MKAVVVSFDRMHLGYLGCYGNSWIQTPHFDRLAVEAVVFDQHFGENFAENAANHAWWTGCYQFPRDDQTQQAALPLLFASLREAGIGAHLLVESATTVPDALAAARPVDGLFDDAARHVRAWGASADEPSLLWLKAAGPRYRFPLESGTQIDAEYHSIVKSRRQIVSQAGDDFPHMEAEAAYASQMTRIDRQLGIFLAALDKTAIAEQPLLIVTAGRGEWVMEVAPSADDGSWFSDEVVHCPLWIRVPGSRQAGSRRQALTQSVDIAATLLEYFGVSKSAPQLDGRNLMPLWEEGETSIRKYAYFGMGRRRRAICDQDFCLVRSEADPSRLFVKPDDRFHRADVASQYLEVVADLEEWLDAFLA